MLFFIENTFRSGSIHQASRLPSIERGTLPSSTCTKCGGDPYSGKGHLSRELHKQSFSWGSRKIIGQKVTLSLSQVRRDYFPKKRCVKVAMKLISMTSPTTASTAANRMSGSCSECFPSRPGKNHKSAVTG